MVGYNKRAIGVFSSRSSVESALNELQNSQFPMDNVSVIVQDKDHPEEIAGAEVRDRTGTKADEGAKTGAVAGGTVGGLTGLLVGLGTLAIPGIGPIMLAGAAATAIATTLAGGAIGAATGSLVGALIGLGIPEDRAKLYQDRISRGDYLVMVEGTDDEIRRAEAVLTRHGIEEWGIYDTPRNDTKDYATTPSARTTAGELDEHQSAVGVFPTYAEAQGALIELRDANFPMSQVSLVGPDTPEPSHLRSGLGGHPGAVTERTKADEGAKAGAATGGILGGLGGLLVGLGALALPGIGPVIAGGALATALATTVAGGAIGAAAGGLTGALVGLGIPEERARYYNDRVAHGDYLVMVDGTHEEIQRAETILNRRGIRDLGIYHPSYPYQTHQPMGMI